jgi:hypothetical protein
MLSSPIRAALARKIWFVLLLCAAPVPLTAAPKYLGPNKCISCHDHDKQKDWSAKDSHTKALQQLEDKNAAKYAKAIGLADPYNLKGACVACHATVFNGDANAGVSCETCHGAGSDYVEPHQQKGSYAKAVPLGMFDTRGNYAVWAKMCNECHILRDQKLIAAGHKSGADFEVGAGSKKIVHWAPAYDFAQLSAAARTAGGGKKAPAPAPPPAPAPAPPKEEAKPTQPAAKPTPAPRPTAAAAVPTTAPPPRAETPVPTAAPPKKEARPEPTSAPTAPAVTARVPTTAPSAAPTAPPRVASPSPAGRVSPAARPSVVIEIVSTPIPPAPPTRVSAEAPTPAPPATLSTAPPATRPPSKTKPKPKPKPKPKTTPAPPSATRTPTKLPAPMEPPRRPPH